MNRVSCDVIEDLIPLYAEDMLSEDSSKLVEEHLDACEECRKYLKELQEMKALPIETNTKPLIKFQQALQRKKWATIILTTFITLLIGTLTVIFITAPKYLPYSEEVVMVSETDSEFILVDFNEEVAGYNLQSYSAESGVGSVNHLTTWTTTWHDWTTTGEMAPIVLNPRGDQVEAVYYYQADGSGDQLIYGEDPHENGGVVTLPRLSLSYFAIVAGVALLIGLAILFAVRANDIYFDRMLKIVFAPFSYLVAQLLVTGWTTTTYSLIRDMSAILLVALLLYGVCWLGLETVKRQSVE